VAEIRKSMKGIRYSPTLALRCVASRRDAGRSAAGRGAAGRCLATMRRIVFWVNPKILVDRRVIILPAQIFFAPSKQKSHTVLPISPANYRVLSTGFIFSPF
jgi:hypothetical protein